MALDPISALLDVGSKVIDRVWPDPAQAASAKLELMKLAVWRTSPDRRSDGHQQS